MKKVLACAAVLALLSACAETAEEPAAEETAVAEDPALAAAVSPEDLVGTWSYTWPSGLAGTSTINADGTYSREMADGTGADGTWELEGDEACFTDEGSEESRCYTVGPEAADGSRVMTTADGEDMTVTPAA